jgi:tRNA A37 threonylcarbamoyladenosine biosynthesis protein TsaE
VHVDAYRLLDAPRNSFSDLDLFGYLESSVFVIEWGIDFVDQVSESYLEIVIKQIENNDQREVSINTFGKRWQGFKL